MGSALSLALGHGFVENAKLVAQCMPSKYWSACQVHIPNYENGASSVLNFPKGGSAKKVLAARLPELRFPVENRVCCLCDNGRRLGTVVRNWFHEDSWPLYYIVPYQIRIDSGEFIWAPKDDDETLHSVAEFCCQSAPAWPDTLYVRVMSGWPEEKGCTGAYQKALRLDKLLYIKRSKRKNGDRFLYHRRNCYIIGDLDHLNEMEELNGYVRSIPTCSTCPPHLRVGTWLRFDEDKEAWLRDPEILVSEDGAILIGLEIEAMNPA